jgi:NTE family protein
MGGFCRLGACNSLKYRAVETSDRVAERCRALYWAAAAAKALLILNIKALEEKTGITPTLVVGTSVGKLGWQSIRGGYTAVQLERLTHHPDGALTVLPYINQDLSGLKLKNFINTKVGGLNGDFLSVSQRSQQNTP